MKRSVINLIGGSTTIVIFVLGLPACQSIGILDNDTDTWRPAPDQTDRIGAVDLINRSSTPPEGPDLAMEDMLERDLPIEEPDEIQPLGLDVVRRAVLENNLDIVIFPFIIQHRTIEQPGDESCSPEQSNTIEQCSNYQT